MFGERPDKLITGTKIELLRFHYKEAEASDFTKKTFYGPIWKQVKDALEEAVVNAVLHKNIRTYMITTIKIHKGFEFEKVLPIIAYLDKNREKHHKLLRQCLRNRNQLHIGIYLCL